MKRGNPALGCDRVPSRCLIHDELRNEQLERISAAPPVPRDLLVRREHQIAARRRGEIAGDGCLDVRFRPHLFHFSVPRHVRQIVSISGLPTALRDGTAPIAGADPQNRLARAPTAERSPPFFVPAGPRSSAIYAMDCGMSPSLDPWIGSRTILTAIARMGETPTPRCRRHHRLSGGEMAAP